MSRSLFTAMCSGKHRKDGRSRGERWRGGGRKIHKPVDQNKQMRRILLDGTVWVLWNQTSLMMQKDLRVNLMCPNQRRVSRRISSRSSELWICHVSSNGTAIVNCLQAWLHPIRGLVHTLVIRNNNLLQKMLQCSIQL